MFNALSYDLIDNIRYRLYQSTVKRQQLCGHLGGISSGVRDPVAIPTHGRQLCAKCLPNFACTGTGWKLERVANDSIFA